MTGWKLDPAGVKQVLELVTAEAEGLGAFLYGTEAAPVDHEDTVMAGLRSEAELLWPVENAVDATLAAQADSLISIARQINAGVLGVLTATAAYQQGNLDMAAQSQSAAAAAADSGDFSWFEQNGVW